MNITHNDAVRILKNLDYYIARFERKTGLKVTDGARKIILGLLAESIQKEKLN